MLQGVISIALLHVKLVLSNRSVFFFTLAMPIVFTAIMTQANLTNFGDAAAANSQIEVIVADRGALGRSLVTNLQGGRQWKVNETSLEEALDRVNDGRSVAALIISGAFTESILDGRPASLELRAHANASSQIRRVEQFISEAADKVVASVVSAEISIRMIGRLDRFWGGQSQPTQEQRRVYIEEDYAQISRALEGAAPVAMRFESTPNVVMAGDNHGANQSSPGVIVLYALLFSVIIAEILILERQLGTLRRILIIPGGKAKIILGKLLGAYLLGVVQISILILAGALIFGVAWGASPAALTMMALALVLVATSMGLLLATVVKNSMQADVLANLVVMVISTLGGAWWPLSAAPQWMRLLGHLFPAAWAMDGFKDIINGSGSIAGILPEFGALLGFAAFFLTIGLLRFRYQ
jgi:linearmycin/streptolysin S transport system permease protein